MLQLIHGNQHSQHPKKLKKQKPGNKMESDIKDSIAPGPKTRETELISKKVSRKIKEKMLKRRN